MVAKIKTSPSFLKLTTKVLLSVVLVALSANGITQESGPVQTPEPGSVLEPMGDAYKAPKKTAAGVGRVTLYRVPGGQRDGVTSVRVNNHFHVALQPGAYSELCVKRLTANMTAQYAKVGEDEAQQIDKAAPIDIKAGQERYVRISEAADGHFELASVSPDVAKKELKDTKRQMHTVTRVPEATECEQVEYVTAKAPAGSVKSQTITLGSDVMFQFGKSSLEDTTEAARRPLDQLIRRFKNQYGDFAKTSITVIGHADPIGDKAQNKSLSAARAAAVRAYMVQSGIPEQKIQSKGVGDAMPIVTNCGKTPTNENIVCNKPNRRVVIDVSVTTGE